jgi:hypothetical protein
MLSRATGDSCWISATLAQRLHFKTCFIRGYKKSRKEWGQVSRGGGTPQPFCFSQELLDAQGCVGLFSLKKKIAKHTCRHLEKIPEKLTRSTQRYVIWQTSSEYRRLIVPSGRILTYVSFVWNIQIPEIFGYPLVRVVPSTDICYKRMNNFVLIF